MRQILKKKSIMYKPKIYNVTQEIIQKVSQRLAFCEVVIIVCFYLHPFSNKRF